MSEEPKRIQMRRTKGWRKPENTVYVGRPTIWGNPFKVGEACGVFPEGMGMHGKAETMIESLSLEQSIEFYHNALRGFLKPEMYPFGHEWRSKFKKHFGGMYTESALNHFLRGKNLACWCPLDQPCHADVLLKLSNKHPG